MSKLIDFFKRHKQTIAIAIVAALSIYSLWQSNQPPTEAEIAAVVSRPTATQAVGRGTPTPKPSNTPILPTPTQTLVVTVTTPAMTLTPGVSTETPTPVPGGSLPLCENHDPNLWHGLISADGTCHYDHEHKHNANEACAVEKFGKAGEWFDGQEISYFWQTPMEQEHKHEAYSYIIRCDLPKVQNDGSDDGNPNYLRTVSVQYHADPMPFFVDGIWAGGYIGTQHSYSVEAEICRKSDDQCGIAQFGGWLNNGDLEIRDELHPEGNPVTQCAPLPDMQVENCPHGPGGSRVHFDNLDFLFPNVDYPIALKDLPRAVTEFWYGEPSKTFEETIEVVNPMVLAIAQADLMVDTQLSTLMTPDKAMYCPDMQCPLNGSTISLHELSFNVNGNSFDGDGDGFADAFFFVDQYLRSNSECMGPGQVTLEGLMCIPFILKHVPVGFFEYGDNEELNLNTAGAQDFDLSPAALGKGNEWWITWPLKMLQSLAEHEH